MDIIFFGSGHFAVPSLAAIRAAGHTVSCVVTQPDRKKGRGLHLEGTPVKIAAQEAGLAIYQPVILNAPGPLEYLSALKPDLLVVIAYGQILSADILKIPRLGAINAHASLLPRYRGAAPINWAIINGEKTTGVTIIKMNERMDAGAVVTQEPCPITDADTAVTLEHKLSELAVPLVIKTLECLQQHSCHAVPQDEHRISFAPKMHKHTGLIHWGKPAVRIHDLVRGCLEWPGAFTYYKGKLLKLFDTSVTTLPESSDAMEPGRIVVVTPDHIVVACADGALHIAELQLEGGKRMPAHVFIAGHRVAAGDSFEENPAL